MRRAGYVEGVLCPGPRMRRLRRAPRPGGVRHGGVRVWPPLVLDLGDEPELPRGVGPQEVQVGCADSAVGVRGKYGDVGGILRAGAARIGGGARPRLESRLGGWSSGVCNSWCGA